MAEAGEYQKLMIVTDNATFFDFTVKLSKKISVLRAAAALRASRSVMAAVDIVAASEKHRLLALRLHRSKFASPVAATEVGGDLVVSCVEKEDSLVMVPDVVWLVSAVSSLLDGYVEQWI